MENLKIRVTTEQESKEAQELFRGLGYERPSWASSCVYDKDWVVAGVDSNSILVSNDDRLVADYKQITLPQLRDMVVLKRNDVEDATHTDQDGWKWYIGADSYVWQVGNPQQLKQWDKSPLDHVDLKPIQKEQIVKEYLDPNNGYEFINWLGFAPPPGNFIEVPEGADSFRENLKFYNTDCSKFYSSGKYWANSTVGHGFKILWQRSLNDKVASAEVARQELKGVDATLADRQSQYGSFAGVANTTVQLMAVIKKSPNGHTMPYAHEEALHMICSKMARIVNGDINHLDSWHDIGGYAKLIEDLIGEAS